MFLEHFSPHAKSLCLLTLGLQVTDWLDYILGKCELPPSFMRRQEPPERKRKKKSAEKEPTGKADSPAHQQQQQLAYVPGRASSAGRPPQVSTKFSLSARHQVQLYSKSPHHTTACNCMPRLVLLSGGFKEGGGIYYTWQCAKQARHVLRPTWRSCTGFSRAMMWHIASSCLHRLEDDLLTRQYLPCGGHLLAALNGCV